MIDCHKPFTLMFTLIQVYNECFKTYDRQYLKDTLLYSMKIINVNTFMRETLSINTEKGYISKQTYALKKK